MNREEEEQVLHPQQPSIYQISRELKKESQSLWNCVQSVLSDAAFVSSIRLLWPGIPQLANLRCGSWYTKEADGTCYFKSTDGHNGNWSFSPTRLNWHVAELAAQKGAVIIVDATRNVHKGGFPDALTKTVPIWAAVVNRAVAQARTIAPLASSTTQLPEWDTSVHLPLWISSNEVKQIEGCMDGWVGLLLSVGADVPGLSKVLRKPLRPLWVSQASRIWVDMVAQPEELPFTPLILVSASHPTMQGRKQCTAAPPACPPQPPNHPAPTACAPQQPQGQAVEAGKAGQAEGLEGSSDPAAQGPAPAPQILGEMEELVSTSYLHVPGAGDDEESWALGLTPTLMWQHAQALTAAGPQGITGLVRHLVSSCTRPAATRPLQDGPGPKGTPLDGMHGSAHALGDAHGLQEAKVAKALLLGPVRVDAHHLRPQGCEPGRASAAQQAWALGQGIHLLADLGVAVGGYEAGAPPGVWAHVDAVLNVGMCEHAAMRARATECAPGCGPGVVGEKGEGGSWRGTLGQGGASPRGAVHGCGSSSRDGAHALPLTHQDIAQPAGQQHAWPPHQVGRTLQAQQAGGRDSIPCPPTLPVPTSPPPPPSLTPPTPLPCTSLQSHGCCDRPPSPSCCNSPLNRSTQPGARGPATQPHPSTATGREGSYMWLPVAPYKLSRFGLAEALAPALQFLSHHVSQGRRVLVHDDHGVDQCVCTVLAFLLACYNRPSSAASSQGHASHVQGHASHAQGHPSHAANPCCLGSSSSSTGSKGAARLAQEQPSASSAGGGGLCSSPAGTAEGGRGPSPRPVPDGDDAGTEAEGAPGCRPLAHLRWRQPFMQDLSTGAVAVPELVTKHLVRQRLAFVATCYPQARPTRGTLKQVYNFFEARRA